MKVAAAQSRRLRRAREDAPAGGLSRALVIGRRSVGADRKVSLDAALRDFGAQA